ncbi:MAG: hypothetical protein COB15_01585 [Flavobacteriales bacterium]|nr:MAG: hypothetical protein COB15_01585 [Flavobacteriales bacterium]
MKIKELHFATLTFEGNNHLLIKYKNNVEVGLSEAVEIVDEALKLVSGNKFLLLTDARDIFSSMDSEARKYITSHDEVNDLVIAHAITVNGMGIRLLAQFFLNLNKKRSYPQKIFSDIEKASGWLLKQYYFEVNSSKELSE